MQCYKHPKVETFLACGKCERPICVKCSIPGPAGMRCPDCSAMRSSTLYKIPPHLLIIATLVGIICGTVGAAVMMAVTFFVFFIGPAYGGIIAEIVLRCVARKRGPIVEAIGVGSIILGALIVVGYEYGPMLIASLHGGHADGGDGDIVMSVGMIAWPLIGVALAAGTCYSRLK